MYYAIKYHPSTMLLHYDTVILTLVLPADVLSIADQLV
jgi:hypothetical protein